MMLMMLMLSDRGWPMWHRIRVVDCKGHNQASQTVGGGVRCVCLPLHLVQ